MGAFNPHFVPSCSLRPHLGIVGLWVFAAIGVANPAAAQRQPMSVGEMLELLKDAPGNGYQWAGSTWSSDSARQGKCVLVPPDSTEGCPDECDYPNGDASGGTITGSDCAGLVSKAWQLGGPQSVDKPAKVRFGARAFRTSSVDWDVVDFADLQPGDSVSNGDHVMFFDRKEGEKYYWYEAMGCRWGIVHGARRTFTKSSWIAARRKDISADRECSTNTCSGHGACSRGICTCQTGYTGRDCEQCVSEYVGYPICHVPAIQCTPQGELRCGNRVTINPSMGNSQLAAYSCSLINPGGAELVYQFRPTATGKATVNLEGGGALALLRDTCAAEACVMANTGPIEFEFKRDLPMFVAVESAGANGDLTLTVDCSTGPWIGDACTDDSGCKMNKADGTALSGFCHKLAGESTGFCSLDCTNTNGCPDLLPEKAATACIARPAAPTSGLCVSTQSTLNAYCGSIPGTSKQTLPRFKRPEANAQVCAPRPAGVPACLGSIGGRVLDAATRTPLAGVQISASGTSSQSTTTNPLGEFLFERVPCQSLTLVYSAPGYAATSAFATSKHETTTDVSDVLLARDSGCAEATNIRGFVTDGAAAEPKAIPYATVELRRGVDARQGDVVRTAFTESDGSFNLSDLSPGSYTATILAEKFSSTWTNQTACEAETDAGNVSVIPQQAQAPMRIALRWVRPPDLDLHIQLPNGEEVYYRDECRGSSTEPPFVTLDIDREDPAGPEVITVYRYMPGTYSIFVQNFSQQVRTIFFGDDDPLLHDVSFANAEASVTVYGPDGKDLAHFAPPAGTGYFWDVFSFDGGNSGAISTVQRLTNAHKNPDTEYSTDHCGP